MNQLEDIEEFQDIWKKQGRFVRVLRFPEIVLVDINSTFSANELRRIASFLDECEDKPEVDMKGVYISE